MTKHYYTGGFEYDHTKQLTLIHHPEGIVNVTYGTGYVYEYEYFIKDHLGNTRIAFSTDGSTKSLKQRVVYYPFGMIAEEYNLNSNQYTYNGKEFQGDLDLNWYDYGARFYDVQVGRWFNIDPVSDLYYSFSPFNYTLNNPINNTDPNGMWVESQDSYSTSDSKEIFQFLSIMFGIGMSPINPATPASTEQAGEQENARDAASEVGKDVIKLYSFNKSIYSFIPGGGILNWYLDKKYGIEPEGSLMQEVGFEAAAFFLPGVKFIKGPGGRAIVKLQDEAIEVIQSLNNNESRKLLLKLPEGFRKVNGVSSQGQKVFTNGKIFISPSGTTHAGSREAWKAAKSVDKLKNTKTRIGTFDINFKKIGK